MAEERRVMYSGQPVVSPAQNQDAYRRALMAMADGGRNPNAARKFTRGTTPLARQYYFRRQPLRRDQLGLISAIENWNPEDNNEEDDPSDDDSPGKRKWGAD